MDIYRVSDWWSRKHHIGYWNFSAESNNSSKKINNSAVESANRITMCFLSLLYLFQANWSKTTLTSLNCYLFVAINWASTYILGVQKSYLW
jgi:hypothetical protein